MDYLLVNTLELGECILHFIFMCIQGIKVKIFPLEAMKAQGGCGCKGPHIRSHGAKR